MQTPIRGYTKSGKQAFYPAPDLMQALTCGCKFARRDDIVQMPPIGLGYAQTPGTVRAQGRDVGSGTEGAPNSGPAKPYFDVREETYVTPN